ncbi:MAG: hypothetical protein ABR524_03615 [Thermoanaerobaculia bacterium]
MIEASLRLLPPDPRWLDFAGFVAPLVNAGDDPAPEIRADAPVEDESRLLVGSTADR